MKLAPAHKILLGYLALEVLLALVQLCWGGPPHRAPAGFGDHLHVAIFFVLDMIFLLNLLLLVWVCNGFLDQYYGYGISPLFSSIRWLALGVALFPYGYLSLLVLCR